MYLVDGNPVPRGTPKTQSYIKFKAPHVLSNFTPFSVRTRAGSEETSLVSIEFLYHWVKGGKNYMERVQGEQFRKHLEDVWEDGHDSKRVKTESGKAGMKRFFGGGGKSSRSSFKPSEWDKDVNETMWVLCVYRALCDENYRKAILETRGKIIIHTETVRGKGGTPYWGACFRPTGKDGVAHGENKLGEILMGIRSDMVSNPESFSKADVLTFEQLKVKIS